MSIIKGATLIDESTTALYQGLSEVLAQDHGSQLQLDIARWIKNSTLDHTSFGEGLSVPFFPQDLSKIFSIPTTTSG